MKHNFVMSFFAAAAMVVSPFACSLLAQEENEPKVETQFYTVPTWVNQDELRELIQNMVFSESWNIQGSSGTISFADNQMVVSNEAAAQERIAYLLNLLWENPIETSPQELKAPAADKNNMTIRVYQLPQGCSMLKTIALTQKFIYFNSWVSEGGYGNICPFAGRVIVLQSEQVHQAIADFYLRLDGKQASSSEGQKKIQAALKSVRTWNFQNETVENIAKEIEKTTGVPVIFDPDLSIDDSFKQQKISFQCKYQTLENVFQLLREYCEVNILPINQSFVVSEREAENWGLYILPLPEISDTKGFIEMIKRCVIPTSWDNTGGEGRIAVANSQVLVFQTPQGVSEIRRFLDSFNGKKPEKSESMKKIEAALSQVKDLDFTKTNLAEAVNIIRNRFDIDIILNYQSGYGADFKIDEISLDKSFKGQTLKSVLDEIAPIPAQTTNLRDSTKIYWNICHNALILGTVCDAREIRETRRYPIPSCFLEKETYTIEFDADVNPCSELIINTIAPASWANMGGSSAIYLCPKKKFMIIAQTPEIHQQIKALLDELEKQTAVETSPAPEPNAYSWKRYGFPVENRTSLFMEQVVANLYPSSWKTSGVLNSQGEYVVLGASVLVYQNETVHKELQRLNNPQYSFSTLSLTRNRRFEAILNSTLDLSVENQPLNEVLETLQRQYGFTLCWDEEIKSRAETGELGKVTLSVNHIPLRSALTLLTRQANLVCAPTDDNKLWIGTPDSATRVLRTYQTPEFTLLHDRPCISGGVEDNPQERRLREKAINAFILRFTPREIWTNQTDKNAAFACAFIDYFSPFPEENDFANSRGNITLLVNQNPYGHQQILQTLHDVASADKVKPWTLTRFRRYRALNEPVEFSLEGKSPVEVSQLISRRFKTNILIDSRCQDAINSLPFDFSDKGLPLSSSLNRWTEKHNLVWGEADDVVFITQPKFAACILVNRYFPPKKEVDDKIEMMYDMYDMDNTDDCEEDELHELMETMDGEAVSGGVFNVQDEAASRDASSESQTLNLDADALTKIIQNGVKNLPAPLTQEELNQFAHALEEKIEKIVNGEKQRAKTMRINLQRRKDSLKILTEFKNVAPRLFPSPLWNSKDAPAEIERVDDSMFIRQTSSGYHQILDYFSRDSGWKASDLGIPAPNSDTFLFLPDTDISENNRMFSL